MSQTSHDNRRHQIDLYLGEIDELRLALSEQASELQRVEDQKALVEAENNDVNQAVATLEADLKRVKRDAEAFGRELRQLRVEKGKVEERRREEGLAAERAMKQAQAQIRVLKEQLEDQKDRARIAEERERSGSMYVTGCTNLIVLH
jgi:chromosome segregation ATPase